MANQLSARDRHNMATEYQFAMQELNLGPWTSYSLMTDPKHMSFVLARYKFCAKMLEGKEQVVEVGCGDGFGLPIMAQSVQHLECVDWEERNIEGCSRRLAHLKNVTYRHFDFNTGSLPQRVDAIYTIDVLEHLEPAREEQFMTNLCRSLKPDGVLITGTPNITSAPYASKQSAEQHINLKSQQTLRALNDTYFQNCFLFGMNDEVLHTGYAAMAHYIWSIGVGLRSDYAK